MALEGLDVSNHNGNVVWSDVAAAGVVLGYAKATESTYFTDPFFATNYNRMKAVGIVAGAYHYWRPDADAVAQIEHFHSVYPKWVPGDLPPCLDFECDDGEYADPEYTPQMLTNHALTCLQTMEKLYGVRPMVYTYPYFYNKRVKSTAFKGYPLWLAAYPALPKQLPGGWQAVTLHQYSSTGPAPKGIYAPKRVDGGVNVDLNRFYGARDDLNRLCGVQPMPAQGSRVFPNGHSIGHGFRDKWEEYEKLGKAMECIGYPITEEMDDGHGMTVQYFERSRFEYHPGENPTVQLGLVGLEAARARGIQV